MRGYLGSVLGNADSRTRLGRAIEAGTLPHALLIAGPVGSGKHTLAIAISAALNCEHRTNSAYPLPCGVCNSCRRIRENNFTDIKLLSKKKDKATVGVGEVRDFREDMFLSATESAHKIYIIESAECLTAEAQNALLTVLEEPPSSVTLILLTTECDKLLTTVRSRVQLITMERFSESELEAHLVKKSREAAEIKAKKPETFRSLIMSAGGILGEAIRLSDPASAEENARARQEIKDIINAITAKSDYASIYRALSSLSTKRQELTEELDGIISALSDLIKVKSTDAPHLTFYSSAGEASIACGDATPARLMRVYDAVILANRNLSQNAGVSGVITSLALTIYSIKNQ